jgi:bifunctional UDP-N-acetylglucosamine pyrophosphorylase/glucosamine-1-phosphate N-acetyltransferase
MTELRSTKPASCVALIPAAGRGSRLGMDVPKIRVPIDGERTIWDVLHARLRSHVDHIHVVLAPDARPGFDAMLDECMPEPYLRSGVSTSVQERPVGMGDAIFGARPVWRHFDHVLIVWGDQVLISHDTLHRVVTAQRASTSRSLTLPLVRPKSPYVEYCFDFSGNLTGVLQSREGDACSAGGLADIGMFALRRDGLVEDWQAYLDQAETGSQTGEINFLPFLPYLSTERGWRVQSVDVDDVAEARGVNTPEDLAYCRQRLARMEEGIEGQIEE